MQKKIIALAVAGLMSGAAFAQTNVTISGIIDIGWTRNSSSDTGSFESRNALDSGIQSGSRFIFAGVEDLGGGNKVGFHMEQGLGNDRQQTAGVWSGTSRQSFLYLTGNWGTLAFGRQYTPQFNLVTAVDPFGTGTAGDVTYGRGVYLMGAGLAPTTIRLDNLAAYVSPSFGGLTVTAGYTANGIGDEAVTVDGADSANYKIWAVSPVYKNGPLLVGFNYHNVKNDAADYKNSVWDLGATYDLGVVKLAGLYGVTKIKSPFDAKGKQWMLGLTAPVGNGAVMASYSRFKEDDDAKASKWAVGYQYNMSKRTNLYVAYAKISTNDDAEGFFSTRSAIGGVLGGSTASSYDDYTSGLNVGIRHKF